MLLGEYIVASQNGLECLDIWCKLSVDEDLVRTLRRWGMRFLTLERYDTIAAVEDPSRGPEWRVMVGILSVQHDRPAPAKVKFNCAPRSPTANLKSDSFFQVVRTQKRRQFLEEVGADAGKISGPALDIFVCDKAIFADEHEDMTMYLFKVDFLERSRFGLATRGIYEMLA